VQREFDVAIVGAGLAGAFCALLLARSGIPCLLADKCRFPRDKVCAGALSWKVLRFVECLRSDWVPDFMASHRSVLSHGISFIASNGSRLDFPFMAGGGSDTTGAVAGRTPAPGLVCRRKDFDNYLIAMVRQEPLITLVEGCEVRDVQRTEAGMLLACKMQREASFRARLVVGADGARSVVARRLAGGIGDCRQGSVAVRAYFRGVGGFARDNHIELHLLRQTAPGYFWTFPLGDGFANVGIGMPSDLVVRRGLDLRGMLAQTIRNTAWIEPRFSGAVMEGTARGWPLPVASGKRAISGERFLLLGDAAALVEPFTGEGIGNAMLSAQIASRHIGDCVASDDFTRRRMKQYDDEVYGALWPELSAGHRLRRVARHPRLLDFIAGKAGRHTAVKETLASMVTDASARAQVASLLFYLKAVLAR
jgi:geranylgeranyl reductase family protein